MRSSRIESRFEWWRGWLDHYLLAAVVLCFLMGDTLICVTGFLPCLLLPVLLAAGFTVGLSLALAAMAVYFRDLNHLYGLVTLAWTYLTPLFYPISIIPAQWMLLLRFNPMLYYVGIFRALVYEGVLPPVLDWVIAGLFSILTLSGGCLIFHALKKGFFLHL